MTPRRNQEPPKSLPLPLYTQAMQHAQEQFSNRVRDLKKLKARLAAFDRFMPAVRAAGVDLCPSEIWGACGTHLFISNDKTNRERNALLVRALVSAGMRLVERRDCGATRGDYSATLAHGDLVVFLGVDGRGETAVLAREAVAMGAGASERGSA